MAAFADTYRQPRRKTNIVRLAVLAVATAAAGSAAYLASSVTPTIVQVVQPPSIRTGEVLVAGGTLKVGTTLSATDLRWQLWPLEGIDATMVSRLTAPDSMKDFEGALLKTSVAAGEPMRLDRVIRKITGGIMAAMLTPGFRAFAINIDNHGASSAGGFILPNDRVDVMRVTKESTAGTRTQGGEVTLSETILHNVRVLAIGRNIKDANGENVSMGDTATLELTPHQVEMVLLSQSTGQLSLALRSLQDSEMTALVDGTPSKISVRSAGALAKRFTCRGSSCTEWR